jgi:hypothetical protein
LRKKANYRGTYRIASISIYEKLKHLLCIDTYICNKIIVRDRWMINTKFKLPAISKRKGKEETYLRK